MQFETFIFRDDGTIPNNPKLPVVVYRHAVTAPDTGRDMEERFIRNGWSGIWHNGIFDYHHFHSNAHEVLGIKSGKARVHLGGAHGRIVEVEEGDVMILPAGTGHKCLEFSGGFYVIGAYPVGQEAYDLCRDYGEDRHIKDRIAAVPLPKSDPVFGAKGVLRKEWK